MSQLINLDDVQDVTYKVDAPDHTRPQTPPQVTPPPRKEPKGNVVMVELPYGLEVTEELEGLIQAAVSSYIDAYQEAILQRMRDGVRVIKR